MGKTVPASHLNEEHIGYVLNTDFTPESQQAIITLAQKFQDRFGEAILLPKPEWLHITLMDWLAPLVDYGRDKDDIFPEIFPDYDRHLTEVLRGVGPIQVNFDQITAGPEAIFISGKDNGQYQTIRDSFIGRVSLLPNTKKPPKIVHSTIARFQEAIELEPVQEFAAQQSFSLPVMVSDFRLLRTTDTKMQTLKMIKRYNLR